MKSINKNIICELNILKNRIESGESPLQALQTMGIPLLSSDASFLRQWESLSQLLIEGKTLPSKAISEFCEQLESKNKLIELCKQKSFSSRMQAIVSATITLFMILSSFFIFPKELKAGPIILVTSLVLSAFSIALIHLLLKNFESNFSFLNWISFQRNISLSLQCGMTLPHALQENTPLPDDVKGWPYSIRLSLSENLKNNFETSRPLKKEKLDPLWTFGLRSWNSVLNNYNQGLSQSAILTKLCQLQEDEFKNTMIFKSEKLAYLMLIPLFGLSLPAVLLILFGPIIRALL